MKHFFIIAAVIAASLCSCNQRSRLVIKACCNLPKGTRIINIGYAGSNNVEIGTVSLVSDTFRYTDGNYKFDDHANPHCPVIKIKRDEI